MATQTDKLFDQARRLDDATKVELILLLQDSLHDGKLPRLTKEQKVELDRRAKFYDENPHLLLDGEEVMERLRLKLESARKPRRKRA